MLSRWADTDERVIRRVLGGEQEAFGILVRRYLAPVQAVARAHTESSVDAEDVAQETFLRAYQRLDSLRERGRFGAWLITIARNSACTLLRKQRREAALVAEAEVAQERVVEPDVEARELAENVHRQVMRLDEEAREILLLRYYSGLEVREIARLFGISTNAAKKRLMRARARLEKSILEDVERVQAARKPSETQALSILAVVTEAPAPWAGAVAGTGAASGTGLLLGVLAMKKALVVVGIVALVVAGGASYHYSTLSGQAAVEQTAGNASASAPETASAKPVAGETPTVPAKVQGPHEPPAVQETQASVSTHGGISGTVMQVSGQPAVGSRVWVVGMRADDPQHEKTESDTSGRFAIEQLSSDEYEVYAAPPGHETYDVSHEARRPLKVTVGPGENVRGVRLTVGAGWRIWGRVTDQDGLPVAGADVWAWATTEGDVETQAAAKVKTGADGAYLMEGLPEDGRADLQLHARMDGYLMLEDSQYRGKLEEMERDLVLHEQATLKGHVRDAATREPVTEFVLASIQASAEKAELESSTLNGMLTGRGSEKTNDPEGAFTLRAEALGDILLLASAPGYTARSQVVPGIEAGREYAGIEVLLEKGSVLRGVVVDESGTPLADAAVFLGYPPWAVESVENVVKEAKVKTGADGSFELAGVPRGSQLVTALLPGYAPGMAELDAAQPESSRRIVLSQGGSVQGRVLLDGQPVPVKDCTFFAHFGPAVGFGEIQQDGEQYGITRLAPGPAEIECLPDNLEPWSSGGFWMHGIANIEEGETATMDFEFTSGVTAVEGVVRHDGQPVARAPIRITTTDPDGAQMGFRGHTDDNGAYRFENVPAGPWQGEVWWDRPDGQHTKPTFTVDVNGEETLHHDVDLGL